MEGILLFLSAGLLLMTQGGLAEYKTYYVERDCQQGNLTIPLDLEGAGSAVIVGSTERTSYSVAMDCRIVFSVLSVNYGIVVAVREIGFRSYLVGSCKDYIEINKITMCNYIYRPKEGHHFDSTGNTMELLYHVSGEGMNNSTLSGHRGFTVTVTAFDKGGHCADLEGDWFQCENGKCIWSELHCDTHNNCGDISDERDCDPEIGGRYTVLIILGLLILLLLIIMCISTLLCSKNETIRRLSNRLRSRTLSYMPRFSR